MALKLVVTNAGTLATKYSNNVGTVHDLLIRLANANSEIEGHVVYIDKQESMEQFGLNAIGKITSRSCKEAVDQLYEKFNPDYLLIFGSQDIFPFQLLNNLIYTRTEERLIPSDLPYANGNPFSTGIRDFLNPTRSVGRIPDIPAVPDIDSIKAVIEGVTTHQSRHRDYYLNYFALCAERWAPSTKETLTNVFGNASHLITVPGDTAWNNSQLTSPTHYINCHGAYRFHGFQGESSDGARRPDALFASNLISKIADGTIVASGCCYGATLFQPVRGMKAIPMQYLENGAVAYIGSSTVTYGGVETSQCADVLCKLFLQNILAGMTSGAALLKARQDFIDQCLQKFEVRQAKVLSQFYLLGDPSLQPVS